MKSERILAEGGVWMLGVVNGLLVGLAIEGGRIMYANSLISQAMAEALGRDRNIGYMLKPVWSSFLPIVCIAVFGVTSYLIHTVFVRHPTSLVVLWCLMGGGALSVGYYMSPLKQSYASLLYLIVFGIIIGFTYWSWIKNRHSGLRLWLVIGITSVLVLVTAVQIIGLVTAQRNELRQPLMWLICLGIVIVINFVYGSIVHRLLASSC